MNRGFTRDAVMQKSPNQKTLSRAGTEYHNPFNSKIENNMIQNSPKPKSPFNCKPLTRSPFNIDRRNFNRDYSMSVKNDYRMSDATMRPATPSPNKGFYCNSFANQSQRNYFQNIIDQNQNSFRKRITAMNPNTNFIERENPFKSIRASHQTPFSNSLSAPKHPFNQPTNPSFQSNSFQNRNPFSNITHKLINTKTQNPQNCPFSK